MKKRSVFLIVGSILVVAAIAASLIFVFSGNDENGGDITDPPAKELRLNGTWLVVANYVNDAPVFIDNQFMIFTDTEAAMYKDTTGEAYAKSSYTVDDANQLILSDLSRQYKIAQKSDNCIRLYDGTDTYMLLIRNSSADRKAEAVDAALLAGKWNISMKGEDLNNGEALEFENATLKYYKAGSATPAATADFTIESNLLTAASLNMKMRCYKVSDFCVILLEETGIVWELTK